MRRQPGHDRVTNTALEMPAVASVTNRWSIWRSCLIGAMLLALIAACASTPATPSASAGNKPTVVVQSPANGAAVAVGQQLTVVGAASDTVGVDHVALFVDGVTVTSTPAGQPATLVPFSLAWLATPAGPHVLQVIAYRADGTASDPTILNVVAGAGGSGLAGSGLPTIAPVASQPGPATPKPTRKPKPPKTPKPTATATPTATPTSPTVTPDPSGNAPDDIDNEPYQIELIPNNSACPPIPTGVPVTASGCIWEQISAPAGDPTDDLEFTQGPETSYYMVLTACSDTSDTTVWSLSDEDSTTGCMDGLSKTSSGGNPGSQPLQVRFATVGAQTYNLYQFTVYQCAFADCASQ